MRLVGFVVRMLWFLFVMIVLDSVLNWLCRLVGCVFWVLKLGVRIGVSGVNGVMFVCVYLIVVLIMKLKLFYFLVCDCVVLCCEILVIICVDMVFDWGLVECWIEVVLGLLVVVSMNRFFLCCFVSVNVLLSVLILRYGFIVRVFVFRGELGVSYVLV